MSKRLEGIKELYAEELADGSTIRVTEVDYAHLIEQAERANKNAQDLEDMDWQLYSTQQRVDELEQQNKRYRKDLCSVNEELITLLELDTLTDDDKRDCLESAKKIIEEALEDEPNK